MDWSNPIGQSCKEIENMKNRVDAAIARHGGVRFDGGYMFPSKKAGKQAASEVLGDMRGDSKKLPMTRYM